jgi:hypothetical protein
MEQELERTIPLAYATPAISHKPSSVGLWILMFGGLGLIFLGGCFTIGILFMLTNDIDDNALVWRTRSYVFHIVLYLLAFACFAGGASLIVMAVRGVFRHLKN